MATYKRRIVYLSDEEWGKAVSQSKARDMSASSYIRALIIGEAANAKSMTTAPMVFPRSTLQTFEVTFPEERPFTPVPKPTRRK